MSSNRLPIGFCGAHGVAACSECFGRYQAKSDPRDATIARLTAEIATFQAMMLDCEAERDALAADLAAWKERCVAADRDRNALADQRDSLVASLEATKPCEPCQRDDHDQPWHECGGMEPNYDDEPVNP